MKYHVRAFVVFLLLLPITVSAQTKYVSKQVKASIQVLNDKITVNKKGEATVKFTITPNKDWYVYSILEKNGLPITVSSSNEELFTIGKLQEHPKPKKELDEGFEAYVYKHFLPVTITVPIKFSKNTKITKNQNLVLNISLQTLSNLFGAAISEELPITIKVVNRK